MTAHIYGVTGGIGSGKTSVTALLAKYCTAPLLDVDIICRDLLVKGQPGWRALVDCFGSRYVTDTQDIDRSALREAIFNDDSVRQQVNALIHPLARTLVSDAVSRVKHACVFIEIPLLFEAGWRDDVNDVVVVFASDANRIERIMERDGVGESAARKAVEAQMPLTAKVSQADYVIDNSGEWAGTIKQVQLLASRLQAKSWG